jgi:hypothetical protein
LWSKNIFCLQTSNFEVDGNALPEVQPKNLAFNFLIFCLRKQITAMGRMTTTNFFTRILNKIGLSLARL